MTTPITTLRATLAAALVDDANWQTFAFPPPVVLANSVIIVPDNPYITPTNNTRIEISPTANFKIIVTVPLFDNEGNLNRIEENVPPYLLNFVSLIWLTWWQTSRPLLR